MKFLFVVHRVFPYSGGSEYNVKTITETLAGVGHDVDVLTEFGYGDYNGVHVIYDRGQIFSNTYDLIIIHGADMPLQDYVLERLPIIEVPTLYWIIKPSTSNTSMLGMMYATHIGWGTSFDLAHIVKHNMEHKAVYIRYTTDPKFSIGAPTFDTNGKTMFISSGGFTPNKGFEQLIDVFNELQLKDTILVLTGYINHPIRSNNENIITMMCDSREEYLNMLASSNLYIMNSFEEGFGLVLLDAMLNKVPWIGRNIAGAHDMQDYGLVYNTKTELQNLLSSYKKNTILIQAAYDYVLNCRSPKNMAEDFMTIFS